MIGCVKFFTSIFAFIIFAMGIAITAGGIYLNYNKPELWNLVELQQYDDYYKYGTMGLIGLGVLVIICAAFGMYGGCYKKKCPISIYQFGIIILFVLFLGIGVVLIIIFNPFYSDLKDDMNCTSDKKDLAFLKEANDMYVQAQQQFYCKKYTVVYDGEIYSRDGEECPCYIEKPSIWLNKFGLDFFTKNKYLITENKSKGATKLKDCQQPPNYPNKQQFDDLYNKWSPLANYIEKKFSCSGVCQPSPFYMFTNINNGIPSNNEFKNLNPYTGSGCVTEIQDFVGWLKNIIIISSFVAAGFMFINICLSCCICCYSSKKKNMESYYQLGNYYN